MGGANLVDRNDVLDKSVSYGGAGQSLIIATAFTNSLLEIIFKDTFIVIKNTAKSFNYN